VKDMAALVRAGDEVRAMAERIATGEVPSERELCETHLLAPLAGAPHDPVHHAEGDPLVHTAMVVRELVGLDGFAALGADARVALALAALLHDVAKPETAIENGTRVSHPNHAPRGARKARAALHAAGLDAAVRECAVSLCRRHMQPHHALARQGDDIGLLRWLAAVSLEMPVRLLLLLATADARGRRPGRSDDAIALLHDFAADHDLLDPCFPFTDRHARLSCCRGGTRDPRFATQVPEEGALVSVLSGLPGSGKSTRARELEACGAVRISVEELIHAGLDRGTAVQRAKETLREALRQGRDAVWDATMITRAPRRQIASLAEGYGARVRMLALEVPLGERARRVAVRGTDVPEKVLVNMLRSWELPTYDEALIVEGRPERVCGVETVSR